MDIKNQSTPDKFMLNLEYGVTVNFSSMNNSFTMGDNYTKRNSKGINALNMSLNCKFSELTDDEAAEAISFLQKHYYYEPQDYNNAGKFTNLDLDAFEFNGGTLSPYKTDLKYHCFNFNHTKTYYNCNDITASFLCAVPSILDSVEPKTNYNPRIFHGILDNPALSANDSYQSIDVNFNIPSAYDGYLNTTEILTDKPIFESGTYRTMYPSLAVTLNDAGRYNESALARFGFNAKSILFRADARNSIFIDDPDDVYEYPYRPIYEDEESFAATTMQYRMFDHYPSYTSQIEHSPKYKKSNVLDVYKKFSLYGFNPNLNNLSLEFNNRSDEEAKRILLFLESHLGSQKFGFHAPHPYNNDDLTTVNLSPHRKSFSTFICPEWSHTVVYKNNNNISATFIECSAF